MISTILAEYPWIIRVGLPMLAVAGFLVGWWLAGRPRLAWWLAALALVPIVLLVLLPDDREVAAGCVLGWTLSLGPEVLANVALFLPPVLLAGVASRKPLAAIGAGVGLSALIEAAQAMLPALGRSCTSDDWIANSAGALIGGALAAGALAVARRRGAARPGRGTA